LEYDKVYADQIIKQFESIPECNESFTLVGFGGDPSVTFGGFKMVSATDRKRSQMEIQPELQAKLSQVTGVNAAAFPRPRLPGANRGSTLSREAPW
jgi:multidrug efflux pump